MTRSAPILSCLVALFALLVPQAPARAQCRLCDKPVTTHEDPTGSDRVALEVETSLNFDRLVLYGSGEGMAMIKPDGASSSNGAIAGVGPRAMVGTVVVRGEPGRTVRVDLPSRIELYSLGGGSITFDQVTSDLPDMPRLDGA